MSYAAANIAPIVEKASFATPAHTPFWQKRKQDPSVLLIQDAIDLFLSASTDRTERTLDNYRFVLNKLVRFMNYYGLTTLMDLDSDMLAGYLESLTTPYIQEKAEANTINKRAWMDRKYWGKKYTDYYLSNLCRPIATMITYYQKRGKLPMVFFDVPHQDCTSDLPTPDDQEFARNPGILFERAGLSAHVIYG